jgi:UDP-galactopyranose mutase
MEKLYGKRFTAKSLERYFESRKIEVPVIRNARDVVISQVGEELYRLFFRNYTRKQWGVYPEQLDAQVTRRLPVRFNRDTRYFSDPWQGIPKYGYTKMFEKMLAHKNIRLLLNTDYKDVIRSIKYRKLIYTGPIDYYFDYRFGKLPYRSLDFECKTLNRKSFQNAAVVNYPNEHEYTRITEYKKFYFQKHPQTTICLEYAKAQGDPYYPVPNEANSALYERYDKEAKKLKNVYFVGRLAQYRYLNMDQAADEGLAAFSEIAE